MTRLLKMVRKAKLLVASIIDLFIRSAEAGAATIALLAQAHNMTTLCQGMVTFNHSIMYGITTTVITNRYTDKR